MRKEEYWQLLLDILINVGRQNDKDKIELSRNSIGPKEPEIILPISLWSYFQSWRQLWKINVSQVNDIVFKSRIDDKNYILRTGLKITIEELIESEQLEKINENIWSLEEIFPVDENEGDWWQNKRGWLYDNFEGVVELIEITLLNNLFLTEEMALQIFRLQKDFDEKEAADHQQILKEIEELKKRNNWT